MASCPASSITTRSQPNATPPCGGAPNRNASNICPNCSSISSADSPKISNTLRCRSRAVDTDAASAQLEPVQDQVVARAAPSAGSRSSVAGAVNGWCTRDPCPDLRRSTRTVAAPSIQQNVPLAFWASAPRRTARSYSAVRPAPLPRDPAGPRRSDTRSPSVRLRSPRGRRRPRPRRRGASRPATRTPSPPQPSTDQAGSAPTLGILHQLVIELLAREISAAGRGDPLIRPPDRQHRSERVEAGPGEDRRPGLQLHPVAEVGLVRSRTDRIISSIGQPGERHRRAPRRVDSHTSARDSGSMARMTSCSSTNDISMSSWVNSRLPVGAEVLVAEAADDLEVAVLPGDHQELLELLRRLRQGVERRPGTAAAGTRKSRAPSGRAPSEDRRLDVHEAPLVQVLADRADHPVPERQHLPHLRAAQVEVAVLEPEVLVGFGPVLDRERRRVGLRQDLEPGRSDLDLARVQLRVDHAGGPRADHARDARPRPRLPTIAQPRAPQGRRRDGTPVAPRPLGRAGR